MQEIVTYIILTGAIAYLIFRFAWRRSKKGCGSCAGACSSINLEKISLEIEEKLRNKNLK
ncbi:MAG: FeoB-associated Cys-rich membrane protein [Bacteroidia bacterium]